VVENLNEQSAEVDLDPRLQFGQRLVVEIGVDLEGDLAGVTVNLDHVGL
jgi:hypothetical protein